jgi:hypothetical protein
MTSSSLVRFVVLARLTLPSILVAIGFLWFFLVPSQRILQNRLAELEKRSGNGAKSPKSLEVLNARLTAIEAELSVIAEEGQKLRPRVESNATRQSQWIRESLPVNSPAKAVASTLDLLRRNSLVCIESRLVPNSPQRDDPLNSHLSKGSNSNTVVSQDHPKVKYRILVQGRFQDVRMALLEMQKVQPNIVPVSIEMEEPNPLGDQRNWTLTFLI